MRTLRAGLFFIVLSMVFMAGCAGKSGMPEGGQQESDLPDAAAERQAEEGEPSEQTVREAQAEEGEPAEQSVTKAWTEDPLVNNESEDEAAADKKQLIRPEGETLSTRIAEPEGFLRVQADAGSLSDFLRGYPMKEDESPVLLYDGTEKGNQQAHAAVFALPIENEDLQQCADSVMRVYAEYFWESGQQERIAFHFVNGFYAEYTRWRDGERIVVDGNQVSWVSSAAYDDSYENMKKYLRCVFCYAGTMSMDAESEPIAAEELRVGDVFLKGGSPGHVVMVVDLCENESGERAFLLAQGYMPAQEFHLLKNPLHIEDPWYYEDEVRFPFLTPEYTFEEGSLRRLSY